MPAALKNVTGKDTTLRPAHAGKRRGKGSIVLYLIAAAEDSDVSGKKEKAKKSSGSMESTAADSYWSVSFARAFSWQPPPVDG
jgi:hypothetical protein